MAEDFASKADEILAKLSKLDAITSQIHFLQQSVDKMNIAVSALQTEVTQIKADLKNSTREINTLKDSVASLNKDVEENQAKVKGLEEKTEDELNKLRLQILEYEVYQRRKNLRFYGIHEETRDEDTTAILYNFLETKLGMTNTCDIKFQRVHRVGKRKQGSEPRAIIARFLRYQDRENVFAHRSSIAGKQGLGIGVDLPRQVVEIRKRLIPKMLEARGQGKRAAFSRSEPYKLFIDGVQYT